MTDSLQSGISTNAATSSIKRNTLKVMPPGLKVLYLAMNCVSGIGLLTCDSKKNLFYREQSHRAELKQECSLTWVLICTSIHGLNENKTYTFANEILVMQWWCSPTGPLCFNKIISRLQCLQHASKHPPHVGFGKQPAAVRGKVWIQLWKAFQHDSLLKSQCLFKYSQQLHYDFFSHSFSYKLLAKLTLHLLHL